MTSNKTKKTLRLPNNITNSPGYIGVKDIEKYAKEVEVQPQTNINCSPYTNINVKYKKSSTNDNKPNKDDSNVIPLKPIKLVSPDLNKANINILSFNSNYSNSSNPLKWNIYIDQKLVQTFTATDLNQTQSLFPSYGVVVYASEGELHFLNRSNIAHQIHITPDPQTNVSFDLTASDSDVNTSFVFDKSTGTAYGYLAPYKEEQPSPPVIEDTSALDPYDIEPSRQLSMSKTKDGIETYVSTYVSGSETNPIDVGVIVKTGDKTYKHIIKDYKLSNEDTFDFLGSWGIIPKSTVNNTVKLTNMNPEDTSISFIVMNSDFGVNFKDNYWTKDKVNDTTSVDPNNENITTVLLEANNTKPLDQSEVEYQKRLRRIKDTVDNVVTLPLTSKEFTLLINGEEQGHFDSNQKLHNFKTGTIEFEVVVVNNEEVLQITNSSNDERSLIEFVYTTNGNLPSINDDPNNFTVPVNNGVNKEGVWLRPKPDYLTDLITLNNSDDFDNIPNFAHLELLANLNQDVTVRVMGKVIGKAYKEDLYDIFNIDFGYGITAYTDSGDYWLQFTRSNDNSPSKVYVELTCTGKNTSLIYDENTPNKTIKYDQKTNTTYFIIHSYDSDPSAS